jgi:hypothetical protein
MANLATLRTRARMHQVLGDPNPVTACVAANHYDIAAGPESLRDGVSRFFAWAADGSGLRVIGGPCRRCGGDVYLEVPDDHPILAEGGVG